MPRKPKAPAANLEEAHVQAMHELEDSTATYLASEMAEVVDPETGHAPMYHGNLVFDMMNLPVKPSQYSINKTDKTAVARSGDLVATFHAIENCLRLLSIPARKLFIYALVMLTQRMNGGPEQQYLVETEEMELARRTVIFPIAEYREQQGKTFHTKNERKEIRKLIQSNLDALFGMCLTWRGKNQFEDLHIFSRRGVVNSKHVEMTFNKDFCTVIRKAGLMMVPQELYWIDSRNPAAISMCLKMAHHISNDENRKKVLAIVAQNRKEAEEEGRIYDAGFDLRTQTLSVRVLLKKNVTLPTYETVMKEDRSVKKRIICPFFDNLDTLCSGERPYLEQYSVLDNGRIIPLDEARNLPYHQFIECMIRYTTTVDLPDATDRLARREHARQLELAGKKEKRARRARKKGKQAA